MATVRRSELSNLRMAAGNEKRYSIVIDEGRVKEWVGIGWIDIGAVDECAEEFCGFPVVIDDEPERKRK